MAEQVQATIDIKLSLDGEPYLPSLCTIHERIGEPGWLLCELTKDGLAPEGADLLGMAAVLTITRQDKSATRDYHGIVVEASRCLDRDGRPMTRVRVAPRLWRATKRTNCRIFQEQSVPDIVKKVLGEAGVPESDQQWSLAGTFEPRVYCCQYRETDFQFVTRLLFEDGIMFVITHDGGVDKLIFSDDPNAIGEIEPSTVPFATLSGFETSRPQMMWLRQQQSVRTDKVFVRDYDSERPKYELQAEVESSDEGAKSLEVYAYPARCADDAIVERRATALLDSIQAERDVISGETTLLSLKLGHCLTVELHPYEAFNQEYLVVSIETDAHEVLSFSDDDSQAARDYRCRFTAVPTSKTTCRLPRCAPAVSVHGVETVVTTGPSGSEIHTEEQGRVKARFHWDRTDPSDDNSSCWMRTEQAHTPDSMLLPRVNWEVSVRYLEGDVDQPIVLGRMYNARTPPPYGLPGANARTALQTATSPGDGSSNEFRMDDSAGCEEMFINASKDLSMKVGNNMTLNIGNNETREIGSNNSLSITNSNSTNVAGSQSVDVGADQKVTVETFMVDEVGGDHTLTIGGNRDLKIGGDHKHSVTGNTDRKVGANQTDLVVGKVEEKTDADWTHDVGAALVEVTTGNRCFTVAGSRTENVGAIKLVATKAGRGVEVGGNLTTKVAGAIIHKVKGDKSDKAGATYTELVAGAQIVKANNVTFEGESLVAVVMGASTLIVSGPAIMLAGTSIKWDGALKDTAALILDN